MKNNVGLWIDHRKAVIVSLKENVEKTMQVTSHMEKQVRVPGGSHKKTSAEDQRDNRFTEHLHKYYDKVVSCIRNADAILILGPGEAKVELRTHLESKALGGRIAGFETMDKMTDREIAAKVRRHFLGSSGNIQ